MSPAEMIFVRVLQKLDLVVLVVVRPKVRLVKQHGPIVNHRVTAPTRYCSVYRFTGLSLLCGPSIAARCNGSRPSFPLRACRLRCRFRRGRRFLFCGVVLLLVVVLILLRLILVLFVLFILAIFFVLCSISFSQVSRNKSNTASFCQGFGRAAVFRARR